MALPSAPMRSSVLCRPASGVVPNTTCARRQREYPPRPIAISTRMAWPNRWSAISFSAPVWLAGCPLTPWASRTAQMPMTM